MHSIQKSQLYNYFLKIKMSGIPDPFLYYVSYAEYERFQNFLEDMNYSGKDQDSIRFFCFTTLEKIDVALSSKNIQYVNFIGEMKDDIIKKEIKDDYDLIIYYPQQKDALRVRFDEDAALSSLIFLLDLGLIADEPFFSFLDDDGELVSLNLFEPVVFEFNSETLQRGQKEIQKDDDDEWTQQN